MNLFKVNFTYFYLIMLASRRILKNYDILLDLLKFSLKNSHNSEFRKFSLIDSLLQLLKSLESNLRGLFSKNFDYKEAHYDRLLKSIFNKDYQEYKNYINTDEKEELIRYFKLLTELTNFTIEKDEGFEIDIIDSELKKIINLLDPLLIRLKLAILSK